MLHLDPPDHGRLRNLVVPAFTARRVDDMRPRIQQIVDEIIDRMESQRHMDLIADFAFRLPVIVICDITYSRAFARLLSLTLLSRAEIDEQNSTISLWRNISTGCSKGAGNKSLGFGMEGRRNVDRDVGL